MSRLLMLDSGAYSVWSKGQTIDRDEYAQFCVDHPDVSYYVNLDVIPGKPGQGGGRFIEEAGGFLTFRDLPCADTEKACREGWANYKALLAVLPEDKVLPVYHHGDDLKWLKKYLDRGVGYLGLGGIAKTKASERARWLASLRPYLLNKDGSPKVKTHGFGVTAWSMVREWPWHSVDSTSWLQAAAFGSVFVPRVRGGRYDYTSEPFDVNFSARVPERVGFGSHYEALQPSVRRDVDAYLSSVGLAAGSYKIENRPTGHKALPRQELWLDRPTGLVAVITAPGLSTSRKHRLRANLLYMREAAKVLPVERLFLAVDFKEGLERLAPNALVAYTAVREYGEPVRLAMLNYVRGGKQPAPQG